MFVCRIQLYESFDEVEMSIRLFWLMSGCQAHESMNLVFSYFIFFIYIYIYRYTLYFFRCTFHTVMYVLVRKYIDVCTPGSSIGVCAEWKSCQI